MELSKGQNLFKRSSEYNTYAEFIKDFPMLKDCKRSIPPFILPDTVNGACVIFGTKDKSQFIYKLTDHSISLLGPSVDMLKNIDDNNGIYHIIHDTFNVSSTIIVKSRDDKEYVYIFNYNGVKYNLTLYINGININMYIKKI